jgi:hypothetical protein
MALSIPIISTFDSKGLDAAQKGLGGLGSSANKVGNFLKASVVPGLIAVTGSVLVFTKGLLPAIQAASDLQENTSKISVIFGDAGKAVTEFAKTAAREIGQSQNQVLAAAGTFGTFGKAAGLAGDQLATFTTDFITLSADLASFNNTTPDEAINAIGSALRGEAEPLRKFGVLLNDATLKTAAMELGIYKGSGALTAQQKILAAQQVIYKQTGDAQGDFSRTSDGLANQQRILSAQFENVKIKIGESLLPIFSSLVKFLNDEVLPSVDRVITAFGEQGLGKGLQQAVAETGKAGEGLVAAFKFIAVNAARAANAVYKFALVTAASAQITAGDRIAGLKLLGKVFDELIDVDELEKSFTNFAYQVRVLNGAVSSQNQTILEAEERLDSFGKKAKTAATTLTDGDDPKALTGAAKKVSEAVKEAAKALNKEMGDALDGAKDRLKIAQEEFNNFSKSVSDVITNALNFGQAFEEGGEDAGLTFFSALQKQADKAKEFADLVEQLLAAGLGSEALQQVIDAGIDSGSQIAKELLKSSENVFKANKLVEEVNAIAKRIGEVSANNFYAAGVSNAQAYLAGVEAAMAVAQAKLGKKGIKLADVKGIGAGFNDSISSTPALTAPTMPSVIPSNVPNNIRGGGVTINVTGGMSTSAEIGQSLLNNLIAYQRVNGPLDLQIAE